MLTWKIYLYIIYKILIVGPLSVCLFIVTFPLWYPVVLVILFKEEVEKNKEAKDVYRS